MSGTQAEPVNGGGQVDKGVQWERWWERGRKGRGRDSQVKWRGGGTSVTSVERKTRGACKWGGGARRAGEIWGGEVGSLCGGCRGKRGIEDGGV